MKNNFWIYLLVIPTLIILSWNSLHLSRENQGYKNALSEINDIKYGLLSVHEWKRQIDDILFIKIDEFHLDTNSREELKTKVEDLLHLGINELEWILVDERKDSDSFLEQLKGGFTGWAADFPQLRREIPNISSNVVAQFEDDATVSDIKRYIKEELKEYLDETFGKEDLTEVNFIMKTYSCDTAIDCAEIIQGKIDANQKKNIWFSIALFLITLLFCFLLWRGKDSKHLFNITFFCLLALLILGISMPMIDLDARISDFALVLLGSEVSFQNQVLFFQSKSITDVVVILFKSADFLSKVVGFLILSFSILLPAGKLISAFAAINFEQEFKNSRVMKFLLYKTGKWSMADVIVVAIFMAYIGFRGVINSQLSRLEDSIENVEVITTNDTTLQIGFFIFTAFTLIGIFFSSQIEKRKSH